MIRAAGTCIAFVSAIVFPWPLTACLALGMAIVEPWVPFSVGLFVDTLYYLPHGSAVPVFTIAGALVTAFSFFVRGRLNAGTMVR